MTTLEFLPVPAADLIRIRQAGQDDFGNLAVSKRSEPGLPLRCCLRLSVQGENVALIAFQPSSLGGPYAEVGPVFIHANPCQELPSKNLFPADFRDRRAVLRPYDVSGQMMDGLLVEPGGSETGLTTQFDDPRVALVQVRNVIAGCWNFSVCRAG